MPRTVAEVGNIIFEQLTAEEKAHLADAMQRAAAAADDNNDVFYRNLGNAGAAVPISEGDEVTETDMRAMCRILERARRNEDQVDEIDWQCLCENAFGYGNEERFMALYAAAAEPGSIGDIVFAQLNADEKVRLGNAMRAAARSAQGDQSDDLYCAMANLGVDVPGSADERPSVADLRMMCARIAEAWSGPRAQDPAMERRRILAGCFGRDRVERVTALYVAASE